MADTIIENRIEYDTKDAQTNTKNLTSKLTKLASAAALAFANVVSLEGLEDQILDLSKTSGVTADVLNESLYQALSAGVPITEDGGEDE